MKYQMSWQDARENTWRLFQKRKKEHMDKVRLTNEDFEKGNTLSAEKRMGKEDGGLARHATEC